MGDSGRSRRSVVRGFALGGLALPVLAACGAKDPATAPATTTPASTTPATTPSPSRPPGTSRHSPRPHHHDTPTDTPTDTATDAPASTAPKPAGVALAATADIPVGGGAVFPAHGCVVTQPSAGTFHGFSDICTHAGCPVASVADGTINCPCHGSRFSIVDGSVQTGPAASPLPARHVVVAEGQVRLS